MPKSTVLTENSFVTNSRENNVQNMAIMFFRINSGFKCNNFCFSKSQPKITAKSQHEKAFLVPNLKFFSFTQIFAFRQIRGC